MEIKNTGLLKPYQIDRRLRDTSTNIKKFLDNINDDLSNLEACLILADLIESDLHELKIHYKEMIKFNRNPKPYYTSLKGRAPKQSKTNNNAVQTSTPKTTTITTTTPSQPTPTTIPTLTPNLTPTPTLTLTPTPTPSTTTNTNTNTKSKKGKKSQKK